MGKKPNQKDIEGARTRKSPRLGAPHGAPIFLGAILLAQNQISSKSLTHNKLNLIKLNLEFISEQISP